MPWQQDSGLLDIINGLPVRPRPQSVLFAPPDPAAMGANAGSVAAALATPAAPAASPRLPQVFNAGEQGVPDIAIPATGGAPPGPGYRRTISNEGGPTFWQRVRPEERGVNGQDLLRQGTSVAEIQAAHPGWSASQQYGLYRQLQNEAANVARQNFAVGNEAANANAGIMTNADRVASTTAGAHATTANAHLTQAMTDAAKLEAAMGAAHLRQSFIRGLPPNFTPAQVNQAIADEEARGGFAPTRLNFPVGGAASGGAAAAPPAGANFPTQAGGLIQQDTAPLTSNLASIADRLVPRPIAAPGSTSTPRDISAGEMMSQLARHPEGQALFASTPQGLANRAALRSYLDRRHGTAAVAHALGGTTPILGGIGHFSPGQPGILGSGGGLLGGLFGGILRGGRMSPDQEGNAMIDAALNRNQW